MPRPIPEGARALHRIAWALALSLALGLLGAEPAIAAPAAAHWSIVSQSQPSVFQAGDTSAAYTLVIRNDGGVQTSRESTVTVTDTLPEAIMGARSEELRATKVTSDGEGANGSGSPRYEMQCPKEGTPTRTVTCTYEEDAEQGAVLPGATIAVTIRVAIPEGAQALTPNSASVSGGGAPGESIGESTPLGDASVPFGLSYFDIAANEESGEPDVQASSHPFELTAALAYTVSSRESSSSNHGKESLLSSSSPRDLEVELPAGLVGDPSSTPRCTQREFQEREGLDCPLDTQVGTVAASFYGTFFPAVYPLYNVVPPPGQPVELGFTIARIGHIPLFFALHDVAGSHGDEYRLVARLNGLPEAGPLHGAILTLWGVPAGGSHDLEREGTTGQGRPQDKEFCRPFVNFERGIEESCPSGVAAKPFLTLPSSCQGESLPFGVFADSWQGQSEAFPAAGQSSPTLAAMTGCERLSFNPLLAVAPETPQAGAPSGYTLALHVPQNEDPRGLATPDLKNAVVTLPPGTVVSPSAGNGLQGCSEEQFELHRLAPASCPSASTIGTVAIATPLLAAPLEGQVFLGDPACEPCTPADAQEGRLIRLLVQAQGAGVTVKLLGTVAINQATGQLTATFPEDPQLPLEDLKLTLDGGEGAPLANGSTCSTPLAASSQLTPYSSAAPVEGPSEPFELTGCTSPRFAPSFVAGTTDNQAGAFSPTTVTVARTDQDEDLQRVAVRLAPGLWGMISKVPRCAEAEAQTGTCATQSRIGSVTVLAGPGADPLALSGSVYLTGPYEGAPFGLSIVVPAVAGPLNLGTLDVRAALTVDPTTGALTITSDQLPQSIDGVPLQIKTVSVDIEREGFTFNPTDCERMTIEATLTSAQGATASVSSPFQAANCATLPFRPKLTALTHARPSKADGAYLHVKVVSGAGQANVAKLKVDLPQQLPARLATLHEACVASVFEANPAACPAGSVVGTATVVTPVLNNPLSGPAYVVSHGGEAFPDLEVVLQGEGVLLRLDGQTSIERGVTSSTFKALPDAPIETFDLVFGTGPHAVLGADLPAQAKGSMCAQKLAMPIAVTGENGAVVKGTTTIAVSGCPRDRRDAPRRRRQPSVTRGA
jgi:uncharacterized repeat protein (TIGR01451 family)